MKNSMGSDCCFNTKIFSEETYDSFSSSTFKAVCMSSLEMPQELIVKFLSDRNNYLEAPKTIEAKETHMSFVFIGNEHVYKMKKKTKQKFLDFSTLEKRKLNCENEFTLNQKLAKGIYLGVVAVTKDAKGKLSIEGKGEPVEWLVKMKRLPEGQMLHSKINNRQLTPEGVHAVADTLIGFYKSQQREAFAPDAYCQRLASYVADYLKELKNQPFNLAEDRLKPVFEWLNSFLFNNRKTIEQRAEKIMDVHGDLKPEHICLLEKPIIFDRLEFNRNLRLLDPLEELSYLAMECDFLNEGWIGELITDIYQKKTGDKFNGELIKFYKITRAVLRSLTAFRHILEPKYKNDPKWKKKGMAYFELAERYL